MVAGRQRGEVRVKKDPWEDSHSLGEVELNIMKGRSGSPDAELALGMTPAQAAPRAVPAAPVDHWRQLAEFALYELAAGGPDPHMRYAGKAAFPCGWQEIVWRAGVYMAFYNYPSAEVVWQHWPYKDVMTKTVNGDPAFPIWLKENWKGLATRRERRTVRTPEKMIVCLSDYAYWMREELPTILKTLPPDPEDAYDVLWEETEDLPHFGRYARFKLLEFYRRYADINIRMHDIRARGGFSPRLTLQLLYPEWTTFDAHKDTEEAVAAAELTAGSARAELEMRLGLPIDFYLLEVFLCDYRQSWEGKRQYPGRSNDSELSYYTKIKSYWGSEYLTQMFDIRDDLTPAVCRGELGGRWYGVREDLGPFLRETGQTWSDHLFVYPFQPLNAGGTLNDARRITMPGEASLEGIRDLARRALPKG